MTIEIHKVTANIGARVEGLDLTKPLDQETSTAVREALNAHKALVFDAEGLDDAGQQAFVRHFGDITTAHPTVSAVDGAPNVLPVDSEGGRAANHWHTDVTFVLNPPQATSLRSVTVPPYGGETLIASSAAAYRDLPESLRRLAETLRAEHTNDRLRRPGGGRRRGAGRPARPVHLDQVPHGAPGGPCPPPKLSAAVEQGGPPSGERGLFIGGSAQRIVGLSAGESRKILDLLQAYVTRPENILRHRWSPNQLVLFDNRITQHYAVDNYDGRPRRLHRVTVAGDIPVGIEGRESYVIEGDASHYTPVAAQPHRATRLSA